VRSRFVFTAPLPHNRGMERPPAIATARTTLTVLAPDDSLLLLDYRIRNRLHLAPWEPARDADYFTEASARARLCQALGDTMAGSALHLAAIARDSGQLVAICSFTNIERGPFQACHLGYSVDHAREGTGLMAEVAQAGIGYAFDRLGLHRIMANHMPRNTRSAALLRRLGFEREGYARASLFIDGQWEDTVLNALVREQPGG
jgi:ribosomal-protein-alanine N-acetyltransferase